MGGVCFLLCFSVARKFLLWYLLLHERVELVVPGFNVANNAGLQSISNQFSIRCNLGTLLDQVIRALMRDRECLLTYLNIGGRLDRKGLELHSGLMVVRRLLDLRCVNG